MEKKLTTTDLAVQYKKLEEFINEYELKKKISNDLKIIKKKIKEKRFNNPNTIQL